MPIYAYRCDSCDQTHEALQKASDAPLVTCPHCEENSLRKIIASVGVLFKGSGFHVNDYNGRASSGSNNGNGKSSESSTKSESSSSSESSSGTKSESKSESKGSCGGGCACH